jgi:hypothetical protein
VLKAIDYALVQPHILYGVVLCANICAVHLDKITKVKKQDSWNPSEQAGINAH